MLMKNFISLSSVSLISCLLMLSLETVRAGTPVEQELKLLQQQREKAVASVIDPIERRYQESLEQMLRRALQAKDLEGSVKIQEAISLLPKEAAKQLAGTWTLLASTGYTATLTFRADGTGNHASGEKFTWRISGAMVFIGIDDSKADKFYLPIRNGQMKGINVWGNELTITKK
jgi:hypothetical protein